MALKSDAILLVSGGGRREEPRRPARSVELLVF